MKHWLREYLGINDLVRNQQMLFDEHATLHHKSDRILKQVNAITPGLGRVIAKLDTQFGRADIDPTRKAESDKLAEETIKRLEAEAKAREPYNQ